MQSNSLATVTDNWIVVRQAGVRTQSLISIASLSAVKTSKTIQLNHLAFSAGCLLMAIATQCSKEAYGATLPFALVGLALLAAAQLTRQASIAFVVDADVVHTPFGTLREAATLVAAVRFIREGGRRQPAFPRVLWLRSYLALLV